MTLTPDQEFLTDQGIVRWTSVGDGDPIVLVHGTPYSSFLWRDVASALAARGRRVYLFDHLGYGQSDKREGQDLTLAAQARRFAAILGHWGLERPGVGACGCRRT